MLISGESPFKGVLILQTSQTRGDAESLSPATPWTPRDGSIVSHKDSFSPSSLSFVI